PTTSTADAWISTVWPFPCDSTTSPVTTTAQPVVRWRTSLSYFGSIGWARAWTSSKQDPSDTVRNDSPPPALESRRVRIQPLTVTVEPTGTSPPRTRATEALGGFTGPPGGISANRQRALHDFVDRAVDGVLPRRQGRDV